MKLRRFLIRTLWVTLTLLTLAAALTGAFWVYFHPTVHRMDGIVYGERSGKQLTMDVLRPDAPNGLAIALMVSGGWKSGAPGSTPTWMAAPLLRRGYTVFAVCHISQPAATVMEIAQDMERGLRYIRHHAPITRSIPCGSASPVAAPGDISA